MKRYISPAKQLLADHSAGSSSDGSPIDLLCSSHLMCDPIPADLIEEKMDSPKAITRTLSRKRCAKPANAINSSCDDYVHIAFREGVCIGTRLFLESAQNPDQ